MLILPRKVYWKLLRVGTLNAREKELNLCQKSFANLHSQNKWRDVSIWCPRSGQPWTASGILQDNHSLVTTPWFKICQSNIVCFLRHTWCHKSLYVNARWSTVNPWLTSLWVLLDLSSLHLERWRYPFLTMYPKEGVPFSLLTLPHDHLPKFQLKFWMCVPWNC